jgi:hypothetical protein
MRLRLFTILLDPTPVEGGSGSGDKGPDLVKAVEGLLAKHGDPNAALRVLLSENYGYRDQIRELKVKLPGDGHVVLDPEKAKAFSAYQAFGTPDVVKTAIEERDQFKGRITAHEREREIGAVAKVAGYDPDVLTTLAGDLSFTIEDGKDKAGKPIKVVSVKDGDKSVPLSDYAAAKWEKFLPSLQPSQGRPNPDGSPPSGGHTPPRPSITQTDEQTERAAQRATGRYSM